MSLKWQEILGKISEFEKKTPYNYCDRWCERCAVERRLRCRVHHNELEQSMLCIASGKDEHDPEIVSQVLKRQFEDAAGGVEDGGEGESFEEGELTELDPEVLESPEFAAVREHIKFAQNHPLPAAAKTYRERAAVFLKEVFFDNKKICGPGLQNDLETVAWYHTLLQVKIERGLAGFHEPACEGDLALYDAVAQFEICRKAVRESLRALRDIREQLPGSAARVRELLALLHHISDRLRELEESL